MATGTYGIPARPGQLGRRQPPSLSRRRLLWIMSAFAGDAKLVCTYRYRETLFGSEHYHYGLVGPDGVTPRPAASNTTRPRTTSPCSAHFTIPTPPPRRLRRRRAALLYNVENRWDIDNHKQTARWDTMAHVLKYYRALKRLGCPVDVITEDKDFQLSLPCRPRRQWWMRNSFNAGPNTPKTAATSSLPAAPARKTGAAIFGRPLGRPHPQPHRRSHHRL